MSPLLLIGSLLAVLALGAAARLLRLGGGAIGSGEEACRIAGEALPGFDAREAFVSEEGDAAVVIGAGGSLALIKQHGTQPVARALVRPVRVSEQSDALLISPPERMFGAVRLKLAPEARDKLLTLL